MNKPKLWDFRIGFNKRNVSIGFNILFSKDESLYPFFFSLNLIKFYIVISKERKNDKWINIYGDKK